MTTLVDLPLSGANGSTSFPDNSGRAWSRPSLSGNNAQIQDNALFLDGNNDVIATFDTLDLVFEGRPFVLQFDIKTTQVTTSSGTAVVFDFDGNYTGGWLLGLRSGGAGVLGLYNTTDGYVVTTATPINDGNWHTIRLEVTARTVKFVIDGVDNASGTGNASMFTRNPTVGGFRIGQGASASAQFAGSIRNVKITTPDPAPAMTRSVIRSSYIGWDNVKKVQTVEKWELYRHPEPRVMAPRQFRITRGVPPWWGSAGSTTQLPTYKIRGRVMIRDADTGEDTPLPNIRVALFFRRLHTLVDIQLSDANGYVQFDNLMPGVQAYYGIAFDKDGTPLHNSVLWDRLSSEPGP